VAQDGTLCDLSQGPIDVSQEGPAPGLPATSFYSRLIGAILLRPPNRKAPRASNIIPHSRP